MYLEKFLYFISLQFLIWYCAYSLIYYHLIAGRTGVFLWCVISWFYFSWNMNVRNYSSWSVSWRFCLTHEDLELLNDICDFTTLFFVILRRKSSEWLESSIKRDLGMQFATWSVDSLPGFCFLQTLFLVEEQVIKKEYLACLFSWFR